MLSGKSQEMDKLLNSIVSKEISPDYLNLQGWDEAGAEKTAAYFVDVQEHFQAIRKVIHFISGSLILYQCQENLKVEVFHPLKMAKDLFEETEDAIRSMAVHPPLERHLKFLKQALHYIAPVFHELKIEEAMIYLTKKQIDSILMNINKAYLSLQEASTFELGLNMVAIDSSCAGHSH